MPRMPDVARGIRRVRDSAAAQLDCRENIEARTRARALSAFRQRF
jgi:hypothetical protein